MAADPLEKPENQEWADVLQHVARILAQYPGLAFMPFHLLDKHGETAQTTERRWRTIFGLEMIQYLPEDVDDADPDVSLGRTAHEIWHVIFSRPELLFDEPELAKSFAFRALWQAVEDPRVNHFGLQRHPGAKAWIDASYKKTHRHLAQQAETWHEVPLHIQFNHALIYQMWSGRPDPRVTNRQVKDALRRAWGAIDRAVKSRSAADSFEIIKEEIWPIYQELIDEAYEELLRQLEEEALKKLEDQKRQQQQAAQQAAQQKQQQQQQSIQEKLKDISDKAKDQLDQDAQNEQPKLSEEKNQELKERLEDLDEKLEKKMNRDQLQDAMDEMKDILDQMPDQDKQDGQEQDGDQQDGQEQDGDQQDGQQQDGQQGDPQQGQGGEKSLQQQLKDLQEQMDQAGQQGQPQPGQGGQDGQPMDPSQLSQQQRDELAKQARERMDKAEKQFNEEHESKILDDPSKMTDAQKEQMRKQMEEMRKKMGEQDGQEGEQDGQEGQPGDQDGQAGDGKSKSTDKEHEAKQRERFNKPDKRRDEVTQHDVDAYKRYYNKVRRLIPTTRAQMLQALKQKIRRHMVRNRDEGDLDPDRLSEIPGGKRDVFHEEMRSNRVQYHVSLLIDTSGSMDKAKKEQAIEAAILLMETLEGIPGVKYEIGIYDSTPKVVKGYNEKINPKMKAAIVQEILSGTGSTQAHVALEEAMERQRMVGGDKLIMMVNDGDPDYNFDRDDYRRLILNEKGTDVHGFGLGDGAALVEELFPKGRGWWMKDSKELAARIRQILRAKLLRNSPR